MTPTTYAEFDALQAAQKEAAKQFAQRYLRECCSSLVDIALRKGFSRSLEDLVRSFALDCLRKGKSLPSMLEMERFRLPKEDFEYYSRHGQPHYPEIVKDHQSERMSNGVVVIPRDPTGQAAE